MKNLLRDKREGYIVFGSLIVGMLLKPTYRKVASYLADRFTKKN